MDEIFDVGMMEMEIHLAFVALNILLQYFEIMTWRSS